MPELPEVQTITSDMNSHLKGYLIENVDVVGTYKVFPNKKDFIKGIEGKIIKNVNRVAKFIIVELDSKKYIVFHLAMTGRILLREPAYRDDKFVKVIFTLKKDLKLKKLVFCDMRMFGKVQLVDKEELKAIKDSRGIDPLDQNLTLEQFIQNVRSIRTNIKNLLLNQKVFAGIGNIYANEALYRAKIHPETITKELTEKQAKRLLKEIRYVLNQGIKNRGSTLRDKMYVDIFGKEGTQQNNFNVFMKETCSNCKGEIEYIKLNGRGSYFCPTCQPK